jgi:hypothetical protein
MQIRERSKQWWKGESGGTKGRAEEIQKQVNQEARAVTGCFWTTNLGALATESGLLPAVAQLENRRRRSVLRLLSLPQGGQVKEAMGAASAIGKRLERALGYSGRTERTVLLEEPEALDADTIQEDRLQPRRKHSGRGRSHYVHGRVDARRRSCRILSRSAEWPVLGGPQESHGLQPGSLRRRVRRACQGAGNCSKATDAPERVTIFTDAQAAVKRMSSE